jgi:hypothetical protein
MIEAKQINKIDWIDEAYTRSKSPDESNELFTISIGLSSQKCDED